MPVDAGSQVTEIDKASKVVYWHRELPSARR